MDSQFVGTGIGEVQVVDYGEGFVLIRFHPNEPKTSRVKFDEDTMTMTVAKLKGHPTKHSEITQNGSTFEVLDVRRNGDGFDLLNGNTGTWERWVEA